MRHPLALLVGLIVVAGLELAIFAGGDEPDPVTVRTTVVGSCLVMVLLWFLARTTPAAPTPAWPARHRAAKAPYVDTRTRHLETLLSTDASGSGHTLAGVLADLIPPEATLPPDLTSYLTTVQAGRNPRPPSARQLSRWLTEIENSQ